MAAQNFEYHCKCSVYCLFYNHLGIDCFECKNVIATPQKFYWCGWRQQFSRYFGPLPYLPPISSQWGWNNRSPYEDSEYDVNVVRVFCSDGCQGAHTGKEVFRGSDDEEGHAWGQ